MPPNRLASETSPYLLQHAENPVDWYSWGDEALAHARTSGRPILLSIGYSACHWCHVMAHESFEDPNTAALMNRYFVNIKVDREERPDIDQIYQTAHQLLTERRGGWPLTMFLTPDGKPFFGGTYFPKRPRYRLPGFDQLLQRVADLWAAERNELSAQGDAVVRHLAHTLPVRADGKHESNGLEGSARQAGVELRRSLMQAFDPVDGGFGAAPKFPHPSNLDALLRQAVAAGDERALEAVVFTLRRMAEGGLRDHLGGGFCRYSTDAQWIIPHFEKMLYDNGPLLRLYAQAWQLTGDPLFKTVCEQTAAWIMREMQAEPGGYFSSIDADSEGEEGRFYVWQRDEVAAHLGADMFRLFARRYGLDNAPNFEERAWHLHVATSLADAASAAGMDATEAEEALEQARTRLLALREARVHPGRDEKILTSWNALAIDGMAFAGRVLGRPDWVASARRAMAFIRSRLWRHGCLLATHKDGRSHLNAYLDDYAFLLAAQIELMQCGVLQPDDLAFSGSLAEALLQRFEDSQNGGFFFTSHDHEALVMRPKSGHDGAMASGNGMAALQLQRLGHILGAESYLEAARRTLELFAADIARAPGAFGTFVTAMSEYVEPLTLVIVTGTMPHAAVWHAELGSYCLPGALILRTAGKDALPDVLDKPAGDAPQIWVCQGMQCLPPIDTIGAALDTLGPVRACR